MTPAQLAFMQTHDGRRHDESYFEALKALGEEHHVDDGDEVPEPKPLRLVNAPDERTATVQPPALGTTLDELHAWLTKYIYFAKPEQPDAATLWIAYTHWFAQDQPFSFVPYLLATSAERQSGKSTLLEMAAMVVHAPLDGQDMSAALVGRTCGGRTVLLDEIDGVYSARETSDDSGATDLRTILNAGFKYDGKYMRLDRKSMEPQEWSVFGPKMLVGIGRAVPDTVQDRSIAIRMERKPHAAQLPKARARLLKPTADRLRARLVRLATDVSLDFVDDFPDALDGRRQDVWEPLFALARVAGEAWLARATTASIELTKTEPNVTLGVQMLTDVRDMFEMHGNPEMIPTAELIGRPADPREGTIATGLCALEESPWATLTRGRPVTAFRVSLLLGEFDIRPERAPVGKGYGPKGYWRVHFERAWERYLVDTTDTSDRPDAETKRPDETPPEADPRKQVRGSLSGGVSGVSDVSVEMSIESEFPPSAFSTDEVAW